MNFGNNSTTVGQFFIIIDGEISIVNTNFLGEFGIKVISPQGDHDISFLYLNRDENRYYYSYDHIVIRIRPQISDFTNYISETFPVQFNISDNFYLDGTISGNAVIPVHGQVGSAFARNQFFRPNVETNLKYNSSKVADGQEMVLGKSDELQITASGNSSGFSGLQILSEWDKIPGLWFYSDAEGIHAIDDGIESLTLREGNNYIGIHVFSPFGIWHSKITHPDSQEDAGIEWTVSDLDGGPQGNVAAIDDKGFSTIFVDSSFDFFGVSDGVSLRIKLGEIETVSSSKDDSIGFGTIITILTLIPIAMKQKRRDQY